MMTMPGIGYDYGCGSYDEHGKPEQLDASADAFGAVVRVAGLAVRGGLTRSFFRTRTAFEAATNPLPGVSNGTEARNAR